MLNISVSLLCVGSEFINVCVYTMKVVLYKSRNRPMVKPGGSNAFRHDDGKYVGEDSFVIVGYVRRFLCCKCKKQRHE